MAEDCQVGHKQFYLHKFILNTASHVLALNTFGDGFQVYSFHLLLWDLSEDDEILLIVFPEDRRNICFLSVIRNCYQLPQHSKDNLGMLCNDINNISLSSCCISSNSTVLCISTLFQRALTWSSSTEDKFVSIVSHWSQRSGSVECKSYQ